MKSGNRFTKRLMVKKLVYLCESEDKMAEDKMA